jgi:small-conductance mechanosensitive channel
MEKNVDGISAELDAYWIGKFNIRHLAAELAGVRHARHLRLQRLENRPDAVRLAGEAMAAHTKAEAAHTEAEAAHTSIAVLQANLAQIEWQAKQVGRRREAAAMQRVDLAEETKAARGLNKRLAEQGELAEVALADAEAREQEMRKALSRAKEELRLRSARHVQRVTSLAGAAEMVRGEWEMLRDENKRVLDAKRKDIAERRKALERASVTWVGVRRELGSMIEQTGALRTLLEKTGWELERRNEGICSVLDTVPG